LEREQGQYSMESMLLDLKETELKTQREELREKLDELADRRSDLMIELAKEGTNIDLLSSVMRAVDDKVNVLRASVAALEETIATSAEKIRKNEERMALLKDEAGALAVWIAEREEKRNALSLSGMETEKELHSLRAAEKETSATKEILVREHAKLESELDSVSGKADELLTFLWDDYELSYSEAQKLCAEPITGATRPAAVTEQNKLKNSIKNLGNVNVGAIEEYREVSERYGQMHEQIEDLHRSRESLLKNISELEQRMCVDFVSTMERVNDHFGKVFSELFGGGHAEVKLSEPDNVLESGIEINVAPPGKVIKSLSLLSGGEQAFVAIALYFAILKVNPSPFCIMDEIEAALDEVNVDKFADYVKNYSDKTQFVLITHRRGTMEVAERLYGVTMHEKGISDILSVDVSEIEQRIGKSWE
ncbi:MAG: chromosome segregation protein SMC, partial [Ruminococcus sp.]|nr:chromosome segregation protein SMC [Candidatus Apopatosoma intestinale]